MVVSAANNAHVLARYSSGDLADQSKRASSKGKVRLAEAALPQAALFFKPLPRLRDLVPVSAVGFVHGIHWLALSRRDHVSSVELRYQNESDSMAWDVTQCLTRGVSGARIPS